MPYTINYTDSANKTAITVEDGIIDQSTSIKLPGRSTTAYGTAIAENFLHLLENFAAATAPANPVEGQLWYDTAPGAEQLKIFNDTVWVPANNIFKSFAQPTIAQDGDLWVDQENQQLYLNTQAGGWVLIGPEFSQGLLTGATPKVISGTDDINYNVLQIDILGKPAAIISTKSFTPKVKIDGFTIIYPGYNLSSANITGDGVLKYNGIAEKSENLIVGTSVVPAANFLRSDAISTTSFAMNIRSNSGINFGTNSEMNIGIEGNAGIVQHNIAGSSIDFKLKNDGLLKNLLRLDSAMRIGINTIAPDETLHVTGNTKISPISTDGTSGKLNVLGVTDSTSIATGSLTTAGGLGVSKSVFIGNNLHVGFVGGDYTGGIIKSEKIVPGANNSGTIGTSDLKYNEVHAQKFVGDVTGNVTGTVTGVAGLANKLASTTTFQFQGDVLLDNDLLFDGQGGTKVFNTTVGNQFIANKTAIATTQPDDEVLLNRVRNATGIKKIQVQQLLSSVPTAPVGVILPFAGTTEPSNWLFCDGRILIIANYPALFSVLGYSYKAVGELETGTFALPDMRGRMPICLDQFTNGTAANVVPEATTLGAKSGSSTKTLTVSNLPEHRHNFIESNRQFYAIRDVNEPPPSADVTSFDAPTANAAGQAIAHSGNIDTAGSVGNPIDIMNPYMALNYIIYTGVT